MPADRDLCLLFRRRQALKQMGGALRDIYEEWRNQLKGCLAHAEAVIDFGDDEVRPWACPCLRPLACASCTMLNHLGEERRMSSFWCL